MTRRAARCLAAALAVMLLPSADALAAGLELAPVGSPEFPERGYALTLPTKRSLNADEVTVLENRQTIPGATVVPGTAAGENALGVVLVIDASQSMKGDPIASATAAARTLATHRNGGQTLGIVTFNDKPTALLNPTSDSEEIALALAEPPALARETHIYDAVGAAIDMLDKQGISGGSVVVLSDGADTGSRLTADDIADAAAESGTRIYAVGLRSSRFEADPLRGLAEAGRGSYSEASSPEQLEGIYDELGVHLANQYLIHYRSPAKPNQRVLVEVKVEDVPGVASVEYVSPRLELPAVAPFHRALEETFWRSEAALIAVSVAAGLLLAIALLVLLRPRSRSRTLLHRVHAYTPEGAATGSPQLTAVADRIVVGTEKRLERMRWWPSVKEEIEIARISVAPAQVAALTLLGTVLVGWVLWLVTGIPVAAVLALVTPLSVRAAIRIKLKHERNNFADQLADHLQVVASAMRAGHSFVGALSVANRDAAEPARGEFDRAVADERLGVPIEDALDTITERMKCPDMVHLALVAKLQRETGANAAEVLDRVANTIRERQELRRHIMALTAQQRIARWILTGLPIALAVVLTLINPDYLDPLFQESFGRVLLAIGITGMITGFYVMKKLVEIEV